MAGVQRHDNPLSALLKSDFDMYVALNSCSSQGPLNFSLSSVFSVRPCDGWPWLSINQKPKHRGTTVGQGAFLVGSFEVERLTVNLDKMFLVAADIKKA